MKLLLECLAVRQNLQMIDAAGDTPLTLAAKHGTAAVIELMLAAGANPNFLDAGQKSPLGLAIEHKKKDNVDALKSMQQSPTTSIAAARQGRITRRKHRRAHAKLVPVAARCTRSLAARGCSSVRCHAHCSPPLRRARCQAP